MICKIKKYFKILFLVILTSSMIFPLYASLQLDDGSSFITKAEFDSVLSDFNAQLTTFEASINSKIDSQVTSYLDKNGVWKGIEQTMEAVPTSTFGWAFTTKAGTLYVMNGNTSKVTTYTWASSSYKTEVTNMEEVAVKEISKDGLCNMIINIAENTLASGTGQIGKTGSDTWGCAYVNDISLDIERGGDTFHGYTTSWVVNTPLGSNVKFTYPTLINAYFFVKTGDKIKFLFNGTKYNKTVEIGTTKEQDMRVSITDWKASVY